MVSNTLGAWVNDGITDQRINARHVSAPKIALAMVFACLMDVLLTAVEDRLCSKVSLEERSSKAMTKGGQLMPAGADASSCGFGDRTYFHGGV